MNMLRQICHVGVFSLFACNAPLVSAQAETLPPRGPVSFATYDQNGDGIVTREEFNAVRKARQAEDPGWGGRRRGVADAPTFDELDSNGDGQLSEDELMAGQAEQATQRRAAGLGMGQGPGKGQGPGMSRPSFTDYDLNGDGMISEEEFSEARAERIGDRASEGYGMRNQDRAPSFEDLDKNGDGRISPQEFAEHQQRRR